MRQLLPLILCALLLSACGYKGPLYLPKPNPEMQQPAPPPAQKQEEKDNK